MTSAWCSRCSGRDGLTLPSAGTALLHGSRSKQNLINDLCDDLDVARYALVPGGGLPPRIFRAAAKRAKVRNGDISKVGAAIAAKAGLAWGPECHTGASRATTAQTVTREGIEVVVRALAILAKAELPARGAGRA